MKTGFMLGLLMGSVVVFSSAQGNSYYQPGHGNSDKQVKHACKDRIRENIWSDHQYIQKVEFTRGSYDFWRESHANSGMKGKGRFLNRKGRWKEFDFKCTYSYPQDQVVSASYRKLSNDWGGDQGWNKPDHGNNGHHACKREIDRKILRQHDSASRIRWDNRSVKQWRKSGLEIAFSGYGQFIGGRGRSRSYEFQCTYNTRRDDVSDAWVTVRK